MNARYYVPSLGRFASADTIVPNPAGPQSYNRYSYVLNNPLSYNDPSGHCNQHYQEGSEHYSTCHYLVDEALKHVNGNDYDAIESNWRANADIETLLIILEVYGENPVEVLNHQGAGQTRTCTDGYASFPCEHADRYDICYPGQDCYEPICDTAFDYCTIEISLGLGGGGYVSLTKDKYDNWYLGVGGQLGKSPGLIGGKFVAGTMVNINENGEFLSFANPDEREFAQRFSGLGSSFSIGFGGGGGAVFPAGVNGVAFVETGVYSPQAGLSGGWTFRLSR